MSAMQVAEFLETAIKASNLTLTEISKRASVSRPTIYRILNAEISEVKISTMVGVCDALKLDPVDMIGIYFGRKLT